jgi:hypothetical protein
MSSPLENQTNGSLNRGLTFRFKRTLITGQAGKFQGEVIKNETDKAPSMIEYRISRMVDHLSSFNVRLALLATTVFLLSSFGVLGDAAQGMAIGGINAVIEGVDMVQGAVEVFGKMRAGELHLDGGLVEIMQYASINGSFSEYLIDPSTARSISDLVLSTVADDSVDILSNLGK